MPLRRRFIEKLQQQIRSFENGLQGFEYARERLLNERAQVSGGDAIRIDAALERNRDCIESLRRDLCAAQERLARELRR